MLKTKGTLVNEFGEVVGSYYYSGAAMSYTVTLYGIRRSGYTEEGIRALAGRLELQVWEG